MRQRDQLVKTTADLAALDRLIAAWKEEHNRALGLARVDLDARLFKVNEFRGALSDLSALMMTRTEAKASFDAISAKVDLSVAAHTNFLQTAVYEEQHASLTQQIRVLQDWRNTVNGRVAAFIGVSFFGGGAIGSLVSILAGKHA